MTMRCRIMRGGGDTAERAEPGAGSVVEAQPAGTIAADEHDCADIRPKLARGVLDERGAVKQRLGLVAAEPS